VWTDVIASCSIGGAALDALDQALDILWVESHSASQVHRVEVAAYDKSLHGSRVDVEEDRGLLGRQQGSTVGR